MGILCPAQVSHLHSDPPSTMTHARLQMICCCCSVAKPCPTHCDPMNCSMPGFPVLHYVPQFAENHAHWVSDAIQPSHPLSSPSLPALNLSQHQGLFQQVRPSHQVAKVLKLQLQQDPTKDLIKYKCQPVPTCFFGQEDKILAKPLFDSLPNLNKV